MKIAIIHNPNAFRGEAAGSELCRVPLSWLFTLTATRFRNRNSHSLSNWNRRHWSMEQCAGGKVAS